MPDGSIATVLSLVAAVVWGASDFCGGLGAKGADSVAVVIVAHASGLLCVLLLALAMREPLPSSTTLAWGVASGIGAAIGFSAFYRALAVGQMGINAPIAATTTNVLAVLFGVWKEGLPSTIQILGFVLSMIAICLMTMSVGHRAPPKGLALAFSAGLGFSVYLICSRQAAHEAVYWPLVIARASSVLCLLFFVTVRRRRWMPASRLMAFLVLAGVLDTLGNLLFVHAVRRGRLDVTTILSSLYPAITVLLARFILKERLSRLQATGMATALVAIPMIVGHG